MPPARCRGGRRALRGVASAHASRGGAVAEGGVTGAAPAGEKRGPARARARGRAAGLPGALAATEAALGGDGRAAPSPKAARCALLEGFSLHANTHLHANDRQGLERLCRYGARGALALERLSRAEDGRIAYPAAISAPPREGGAGGEEPVVCRDGGGVEEGVHATIGLGGAATQDV
ncbi:transposase [Corallococcus exercitus]|uniref:transposase n=1 Tax=Corallococcus exercitus TaxID=2316736 RepID=UPI001FD52662|nr:transposase [Corallococcus exercitus]